MPPRRRTPAATPPPPPQALWLRTPEPLFWLTGAGHERITPHDAYFYDCRQRTDKPHIVLQLTLAGTGFFEKANRTTLLHPGMAFLHTIPGNFRYGYPPAHTAVYEQVFISLTGEHADAWYARITAAWGHVLTFPPDNPVAPLMRAIAASRASPTGPLHDRYLASSALYQLLMTILSTLNQSRLAMKPLLTRATAHIHAHAPDPRFRVDALAAAMGCSREHLARAFRDALGVSPSDYLTQHRLRLAAQALRTSTDKLDRIARHAGFAGANYFCRVFRQHVGVTPAQFRTRPWLVMP